MKILIKNDKIGMHIIVVMVMWIMVALLMCVGNVEKAKAADEYASVKITGLYQQTDARSMLDMINDFRTGRKVDGGKTSVWAYNKDGSINTADYTNLEELQYDYKLEEVAMQRAMELVLEFEHSRPNGKPRSEIVPTEYNGTGENIAAGYGGRCEDAQQAFEAWAETDRPYAGQGHRRNMLGRGYNRIGIAHVVIEWQGNLNEGDRPYNYSTKLHYWVQILGTQSTNYGLDQTDAVDVKQTKFVEYLKSKVVASDIEIGEEQLSLSYGDEITIDNVATRLRFNETWPENFNLTWSDGKTSKGKNMVSVEGGYSLRSEDSSIASVTNNTIKGHKVGSTTIVAVSDLGNSTTKRVNVVVTPASIGKATVSFDKEEYEYSGNPLTPEPLVKVGDKVLEKDVDYTVEYSNNTNVGGAIVVIEGCGNYNGTINSSFKIAELGIDDPSIKIEDVEAVTYNSEEQKPQINVKHGEKNLQKETDYTVEYSGNINAGNAKIIVKGKGNYKGTIEKSFIILQKDLTENMVRLDREKIEYNNQNLKPVVTVTDGTRTLVEGTDYTLINNGGTEVGTYEVTVTGKGNYKGVIKKEFYITKKQLKDSMIEFDKDSFIYSGESQKPVVTVADGTRTLVEGTDYTLANNGGENIGTYTVTITARDSGDYEGTAKKEYTIVPKELTHDNINPALISDVEYNGAQHTPRILVTNDGVELEENKDYTLEYINNRNAGTATIQITGKGNYKGYLDKNFNILPRNINNSGIAMICSPNNYEYDGKAKEPTVVLTDELVTGNVNLYAGADYTVTYSNNIEAGTGKVIITGKGNYKGERSADFTILPLITIRDKKPPKSEPKDTDVLDGLGENEKKTIADIMGKLGVDVYIAMEIDKYAKSNNIDADTLRITDSGIAAIRNDKDIKGSKFGLLRPYVKKQTAKSATLKWNKVKGADGYVIYGNTCNLKGKKNKFKKLKTISSGTKLTWTQTKLKRGAFYKYIVVAYRNIGGARVTIAGGPVLHTVTKNGRYCVAKTIKITQVGSKNNTAKVTMKKGRKVAVKAKEIKAAKKLKLIRHKGLCYESSNPEIATVTKKGVIKAIRKGKCKIYVYAQNGISKTVSVTVK